MVINHDDPHHRAELVGGVPERVVRMMKCLSVFTGLLLFGATLCAQENPRVAKPLPDIASLLRDIDARQKEMDKIQKDYIYKEDSQEEELDKDNKVKKTTLEQHEIFYIGKQEISRLLRKDGRDLTPDEANKEKERVDKEVEKAKKRQADKEANDKPDKDDINVETFLRICNFTNPRREVRNGRDTIVFDFSGKPDAKTNGMAQNAVKKVAGTLWVDELGRAVTRMEVHFADSFKIGGGLVASIHKGSWLVVEQGLVNEEVWLPTAVEATFTGRVLLLKGFNQHAVNHYSDYRKFRSKTSVTLAEPEPAKEPTKDK